jgi:hypothetical protein
MHLIELLTTLVSRPNVQEVIRQGIVPLITTISSYMILIRKFERHHYGDRAHFTKDKDDDVIRMKSVRSYCLDLLSSLVEVFGDLAVESILFVVQNICLQT